MRRTASLLCSLSVVTWLTTGCAWTARSPIESAPLFRMALNETERRNADLVRSMLDEQRLGISLTRRGGWFRHRLIPLTYPESFHWLFRKVSHDGTQFRFVSDGRVIVSGAARAGESTDRPVNQMFMVQRSGLAPTQDVAKVGIREEDSHWRALKHRSVSPDGERALVYDERERMLKLVHREQTRTGWCLRLPDNREFTLTAWEAHPRFVIAAISYPDHQGPWWSLLKFSLYSAVFIDTETGRIFQVCDDPRTQDFALFGYVKS